MAKGRHGAWAAYGLVLASLVFTMGYLLGRGSGQTQVQVTVAEQPSVVQSVQPQAEEETAGLLDLNTATQLELEALPGIGPELARRIVEYRTASGGFAAPEQLMDVRGIGEKRFEALKALVKVGDGT